MSPFAVIAIIGLSFATLGAVFWLIGFAVGRGLRRGWVRTTGRWTRFASGLTRAWSVEYIARDGQSYRIFPLMNMTTIRPTGEVDVVYDPERPRRAVIDTFYHRGGAMKTFGVVFLIIGLVSAGIAGLFWMQAG